MKAIKKYADHTHPAVKKCAETLIAGMETEREKLEKIFLFVRDDIIFGFPGKGDLMTASDTINTGMGQCNTKSTLFLALCRASGIPARVHFSLIKKEIQQGLFRGLMYRLMPDTISHSWIEVYIGGTWRRIDSFINDLCFYISGKEELKRQGWDTGYSISCSSGESSAELNIDEEKFVQMDAVVEDQGVWDDPGEYFNTSLYQNRPGTIRLLVYRLAVWRINRRVAELRNRCTMPRGNRKNIRQWKRDTAAI